ncbi:MAG: RdgB/HAM1 family non-canonical purine NTP pyrophosphatase [Brevefilum sp.]
MTPKLLIASRNSGKLQELRAILSHLPLEGLSPLDIGSVIQVQETGSTYLENARLKALAYLSATGLPVLADDSGLEVEVLQGAPGVYSARYAPKENATDADRRSYLLAQLKDKPQPWKAHFHCTAVLALPSGECIVTVGRCDGVIIPDERGTGGFGYDPIFFLSEYQATMAQLPPHEKNRISHRARAVAALLPSIQDKLIDN